MKTNPNLLPLLREFRVLDRKRSGEGVTPLEYQRWFQLRQQLARHLLRPPSAATGERRRSLRVPTRLRVEFGSPEGFTRATIRNLSQGGLFIATPVASEIGTELVLRIRIESSGEELEVEGVVVSNNAGDGFSTQSLGMGVRFNALSDQQKAQIHRIQMEAIGSGAGSGDAEPSV